MKEGEGVAVMASVARMLNIKSGSIKVTAL